MKTNTLPQSVLTGTRKWHFERWDKLRFIAERRLKRIKVLRAQIRRLKAKLK